MELTKAQIKQKYVSIKYIPELYSGSFTQSAIRWLIFNEKKNGFSVCVKRLGRKILIDTEALDKWISEQ